MSLSRLAEHKLIEQAKGGDAAAMAELIRLHHDSLYAFMLRMSGRPDVAEDVVQEAFVRVIKNLDRFDPRFRFSTWLFTIAKRLYVNWSQKFRPVSETDLVQGWEATGGRPEDGATLVETRNSIHEMIVSALASLGDVQREIVLLFHQQEWSIAEISRYLNMPEGTIKSHLHRARRRMREALEQQPRFDADVLSEVLS